MTSRDEVEAIFAEAQGIAIDLVARYTSNARARRILAGRDYYTFVRRAPMVRAKENAQARATRQASRLARAAARPPCPHCGGKVTRGAVVPRGRKLPKYCSHKCARAAIWARYAAKRAA